MELLAQEGQISNADPNSKRAETPEVKNQTLPRNPPSQRWEGPHRVDGEIGSKYLGIGFSVLVSEINRVIMSQKGCRFA